MKKNVFDAKLHTCPTTTIMIFTEGTIIKPKSWFSLYNHNTYIPIGNAIKIIKGWYEQGCNIVYCTSQKGNQADHIASLMKHLGFQGHCLISREVKEKYKDIVEQIRPDVLIEDDCKSIGGAWQMCITKVKPEIKNNIKSIVVSEFKGIDNLPRNAEQL